MKETIAFTESKKLVMDINKPKSNLNKIIFEIIKHYQISDNKIRSYY